MEVEKWPLGRLLSSTNKGLSTSMIVGGRVDLIAFGHLFLREKELRLFLF